MMFKDVQRYARFRFRFMLISIALMVATYLLSDPDAGIITNMTFGVSLLSVLVPLTTFFPYLLLLHLSRKALFDYMDLESIIKRAATSSTGAGMVAISMGLYAVAFAMILQAVLAK